MLHTTKGEIVPRGRMGRVAETATRPFNQDLSASDEMH